MSNDPRQIKFDTQLVRMFKDLDNYLEDQYGQLLPIHPNRLSRGTAANPMNDGLFSTGPVFTLGYGSQYGRGYIVDIEIRSLESLEKEKRQEIEDEAANYLKIILSYYFPNRDLKIVKDAEDYKIIGDFSLGSL